MARHPKKTQVVTGFDTLKAAQRAKKTTPETSATSASPPRSPASGKIATRIDHTALPTRHEITCYECEFHFELTGRAPTTYCPKCRKMLEIKEYTISSEWTETVKTAGKIIVTPEGVLKEGRLAASDIVLNGTVDGGTVQAYRWLELGASAHFQEKDVQARDLRVAEGAKVTLKRKASFRNVEVQGRLKAKLNAAGLVTVKSGGILEGEFHGAHLQVEEGGGLKAKVRVERPDTDEDTSEPSASGMPA